MNRARSTFLILFALAVAGSHGSAIAGDSFAIRAGRILPVCDDLPKEILDGIILVRDGRITAIGADVEVPLNSKFIDLPDATVVPGLVAAVSDLGGPHRGDESVAAGYRAVDSFDRYGDYTKSLAAGVTTVHIAPGSHRLLTGQGAVAKLGGPPSDRILRVASDLAINLGPDVLNPPHDVTYPFPASADVEIVPGRPQRPASRMGQLLGLEEAIGDALAGKPIQPYSLHSPALARAWKAKVPLRIRADQTADILAAARFLQDSKRDGYIVGGAEIEKVANRVFQTVGVPLVYQPRNRFRSPGSDFGRNPDALDSRSCDFRKVCFATLALAPPAGEPVSELRLAAVRACGEGLDRSAALRAITHGPAKILGVADRVGSLRPKMDADFVVLSGDPLDVSTHVQRVYIGGQCVFQPPTDGPLVVKAGTIWAGPGKEIRDGEVLIEDGKIVDVGRTVPHPPFARVIDAGEDAFVTPGLIDAHSHLGLHGDRSTIANDVRLSKLIGVADVTDLRVCRAGITTVMMSPYLGSSRSSSGMPTFRIIGGRIVRVAQAPTSSGGSSKMGSPAIAVKTAGRRRDVRVIDDPAAVLFDVSKTDPITVQQTLKSPLDAGKKYLDSWTKYEKDLKEFLEKKEKGEATKVDEKPKEEETKETTEQDPLGGTWKATVSGEPLPAPITMTIVTQLTGSSVDGRITQSSMGFTGRLSGTFDGKHLSARIEVNIPEVDVPAKLEADLVEEDRMKGTITVMGMTLPVDSNRVEKKAVELTVKRTRRTQDKDGRPVPPKMNPALEPLKRLLEKKIPAVVKVATSAQIREVLALLVDTHQLPLVLLDAQGAELHAERLAEKNVTVVVPPTVLATRRNRDYHQADVLARAGVPIAFQSNAEDAARDLPSVVMYAVERGLDAEDALTALTAGAAKAMKIDDRVGTLEPGKDGDLVIFSGHPFRGPSRILRVVVDGKEVRP